MAALRWTLRLTLIVALLCISPVALAQEPSVSQALQGLAHEAHEGAEAAERGDVAAMQHAYEEAHELWEAIEDRVRASDAAGYSALERALDRVEEGLAAASPDAAALGQAFAHLEEESGEVAARIAAGAGVTAQAATPADVLRGVDAAAAELAKGEAGEARELLEQARLAWPSAEGAIAAKSADDYEAIEDALGAAAGALERSPADTAAASAELARLQTLLQPYTAQQTYTMFDAAAVLLREGLEALLVIVALLAFLRQSGNADKRRWIWGGGLAGVLASVVVGFILQAIFNQASAGQNRELIEGATGLLAAAMLFYVSYWLHSKASLGAWKRYIDERTGQALASGSVLGLAFLAFLAVFREGAETVVFYLGMAPSISQFDLLGGLAIGVVALVAAAVLMLVAGVRLPLRRFFQVAGLLVYYLGFKFVGTGIHALQVAGILPTSPIISLPPLPEAGIYPTWETLLPQLALLVAAVVVFFYLRAQDRRLQQRGPVAG